MQETKDIPLSQIDSNRYQPRLDFNNEAIQELAESIKANGLIQPISVRRNGARYEIIAGERRFRAVGLLQHASITAIIMSVNDAQMAEMALVENIQREDLSAIEEAKAFVSMINSHAMTQEKIASKMGKSQSAIANKIRLLQLPPMIQQAVTEHTITERHARALLGLQKEQQVDIYKKIVEQNLNVRQTEALIETKLEKLAKAPKRGIRGITRSQQVAINTLKAAIRMIEKTGVTINLVESNLEDYYEIILRLPK